MMYCNSALLDYNVVEMEEKLLLVSHLSNSFLEEYYRIHHLNCSLLQKHAHSSVLLSAVDATDGQSDPTYWGKYFSMAPTQFTHLTLAQILVKF